MTEFNLESHGIRNTGNIYRNLSVPELYEEIMRRKEGILGSNGQILVKTGKYTGRSPNDKFIVKEDSSKEKIWWGDVNRSFDEAKFDALYNRLCAYLQGKDVFVQDCYAGAQPEYQLPIRIITEYAWHSMFASNMFIRMKDKSKLQGFDPEFTVINVPKFHAFPELDSTNSEAFVLVNFGKRVVIIGGTSYAGETKKSIFTILNYLLPQKNVLSMHCSANIGKEGDVALFFGLSGTGKTTLSAEPDRNLIGDDEHGWSSKGVFNFEGGCYAKAIRLTTETEPEIFECSTRYGTVLENVNFDPKTRQVDFNDSSFTENTRSAYPITHLKRSIQDGLGGHPKNVFMLTCDAFGVMPPISKLTPDQAMYHFLAGYTAKVAGTERGMGSQPKATFSSCFGAPFMALRPTVYAELLKEKISNNNTKCWLLNTGWSGGPVGIGERMQIKHSRAMIRVAISGGFDNVEFVTDPIFGVSVPTKCDGVPSELLTPVNTWSDKAAYNEKAKELVEGFINNFKQFNEYVTEDVKNAGPKI